ncbi:uncharacterized protein [Anoplolepis gracilipes]|uniref:uncharacterized protein n=1 Tax=Anoplolepis gracilipes TaxID=354296 RepID=UPI003B9EA2AA
MSFYYEEKFRLCMKRLAVVNNTLEQLGTPKAYGKMYIHSKQVLVGWIVYSFILSVIGAQWLTDRTIIWALFQFHKYIGTKFDRINEHMRYLLVNEKYISKYKWKKPVITLRRYVICTDDYKRTLWTLMHLHLELCRIVRELNLIFGTQMTFEMASLITNITVICFGVNILLTQYQKSLPLYQWFGISYWISMLVVRLYVINYICECVQVKAKKIEKIFHELTNIIRYADIWKEIQQFILQAMQRPLKFTGMGYFYFGNDFLRKKLMMCINKLGAVNDTLEQLGTPKAYIGTIFDRINEHIRYLLVNEKYVPKYKWKKPVVALRRYVICPDDYKRTLWTSM